MSRITIRNVSHLGKEPIIVHILDNVKIEQLERFIGVFSTAGAEARGRHGNRGTQLFKVAEKTTG